MRSLGWLNPRNETELQFPYASLPTYLGVFTQVPQLSSSNIALTLMKRQEPEKLLQESLVQFLGLEQRVLFFHPYYPRSLLEGKRAKRMGLSAGLPDLIFPAPGSLGLELKAPGGRQSTIQKSREREWCDYQNFYAVAHGFDEAMEVIREHCKWGYA